MFNFLIHIKFLGFLDSIECLSNRFRIRRKCCEAQLRLCLRLRLASVMKYTFKPLFSDPFTTRINCSDFSCSLYVCTSLHVPQVHVWQEITTNAAPVLAVA